MLKLFERLGGDLTSKTVVSGLMRATKVLLGMLSTVVLTRLLGATEYGMYAYIFSSMLMFTVLYQLGYPSYSLRETAAFLSKADHEGLAWFLSALRCRYVLMCTLYAISFASLYVLEAIDPLYLGALLVVPILAAERILCAVMRGAGYVISSQLTETIIKPAALIALLVGLATWSNVELDAHRTMYAYFMLSAVCLLALVFAWQTLRRSFLSSELTWDRTFLSGSWYLESKDFAFISILTQINNVAPILILGYLGMTEDAGFFKIAHQIATLVTFGLASVNVAFANRFSDATVHSNPEALQKLVTLSTRLTFSAAVVVFVTTYFFGEFLLTQLFGNQYVNSFDALMILCLGQLMNAAAGPVSLILNMSGNENKTSTALMVAAIFNVLLGIPMAYNFGLDGAACAFAFSMCVWNVYLLLQVNRRLSVNSFIFDFKLPSKVPKAGGK